ncbi:hypothetical protein RHGRI_004688 [Rhododendron griersonianum]|uniref:Uncharacterized protein n=1 Tax=Rhododendron griersonianum TaxID=479676 RepID=A0AAV6LBN3_9ERIC|nr:hypothetical protein RHGRI_004688 [Rhododendron griersonianum]
MTTPPPTPLHSAPSLPNCRPQSQRHHARPHNRRRQPSLTKPLDPTQHLVTFNPTYDQLWAPIYDQLRDAKIPSRHSAVAVMEPIRQLHDFLSLALNWGFVGNVAGRLLCGLLISPSHFPGSVSGRREPHWSYFYGCHEPSKTIELLAEGLPGEGRLLARVGDYAAAADIYEKVLELCLMPVCQMQSALVQKLLASASNDVIRCPYLANLEIERKVIMDVYDFGIGRVVIFQAHKDTPVALCFFHSIAPRGLAGDRRGVVPSSGFSFSAQQIQKVIKENRDLDLLAHKVMVATVRCEEIASDKLRCLTSDERRLALEYDMEAFYFDELVRKAKRQ